MEKIPCVKCGKPILPTTAEKNSGMCMPCTRASAEKPPEFDTSISDSQYDDVKDQVASRIGKHLAGLGFRSDDSLRYLRVYGPVVHYVVYVPWKSNLGNNRGLTDGMHLKALFGENLTYAEDFGNRCPLSPEFEFLTGNRCIQVGSYDIAAWETSEQKRKNSRQFTEAIDRICAGRFDKVITESQFCASVLGATPSATKIYCLTRLGRHAEADAWLHLKLHKYAGLRTISGAYPKDSFSTFVDEPSKDILQFASMSSSERLRWVEEITSKNLETSGLRWVYESD